MAQIKVLKIGSDGIPLEHSGTADDVTMVSFTVAGGGPVLAATGLDLNNQNIFDVKDVIFLNPSTATINQTSGNLVVDNILGKERENTMTTAGSIAFPQITDIAGAVDAFRLPSLAGAPSASPTNGGEGHLVFDRTNKDTYIYTGTAWDNLNTVKALDDPDYVAALGGVAIRDALYISAAGEVGKADAAAAGTSQVIGFAVNAALAAAAVTVRKSGVLAGFAGLTVGARYYLGAAGAISATVPSASGSTIVQVGYAKAADKLDIQFQTLGRRI